MASNFNDSWLPVHTVGTEVLNAEAVVHELGHQWRVNHDGPNKGDEKGHCGAFHSNDPLAMAVQTAKSCTMTADLYDRSEAWDGIVGFHYIKIASEVDSEYLRIRRRPEPVPQIAKKPRETPQ